MEISAAITEYYDELYPVTDQLKKFFEKEVSGYKLPVKFLRVGCATGCFEHYLAKCGADVTGIDNYHSFLESANRKKRTQLMALRFFDMTTLEMSRYLGKGFYDVISVLNDRITLLSDSTLMAKFFYDCKQLLCDNGKMIISLPNFDKYSGKNEFMLPEKDSMRVKLHTKVTESFSGEYLCNQYIETGSGKKISVLKDVPINFLTKEKITENAKKAGFNGVKFYSDFEKNDYSPESECLVAVLQ